MRYLRGVMAPESVPKCAGHKSSAPEKPSPSFLSQQHVANLGGVAAPLPHFHFPALVYMIILGRLSAALYLPTSNGSTTSKTEPRRSLLASRNSPPCSSTIVRQTERPNP